MTSTAKNGTSIANDWLISDPIRIHAWRAVARDCLASAGLMLADGDCSALATWLLATHLRVAYSTEPGIAGLADIDWSYVAQAIIDGLLDESAEG